MKITYLGHAGFIVETENALIVADPWLSLTGAFDSSWFQLPANHHLAPLVEQVLGQSKAAKFLYISHEHEDHYDRAFLESLQNRDFTLLIPRYHQPAFRKALADYRCKELIAVADSQAIPFPGGELKLYLDDSELNRDSALLVRAEGEVFLNLNDCRIFDRLRTISMAEGAIDLFTCQFSGASWHPTCYQYPTEEFDRISNGKVTAKYKMVERAIDLLRPRFFIPSAGPVCFLDPELLHLNFSTSGIFRRSPDLRRYVDPVVEKAGTVWKDLMPGDVLDVASGEVSLAPGERYDDAKFGAYVHEYAAKYAGFFQKRELEHRRVDSDAVMQRLSLELQKKLELLVLRDRVTVPLYFGLRERPKEWLRVDFPSNRVQRVEGEIKEPAFYRIEAFAWQVEDVLDGELSWENFGLSFRVRLKRVPDNYDALIHAFLTLDKGQLYRFCQMLIRLESLTERIEVTAGGKTYSINRFCPHNGGDLSEGWVEDDRYLVCARHRWCFDLLNGGVCTTNTATIGAEEVVAREELAST